MEFSFNLWLEYLIRFAHVVAGIAWIGSSFYFIWLDGAFTAPEKPRHNVDGEVFMVHGGFYYQVEKKKIAPGELPKTLHWFKWEATLTWITGILLLVVVYYLNGASLLIDPTVLRLNQLQAVGMSVGILIASWLIYDLLWHPRLVQKDSAKRVVTALTAVFFAGLIYLNTKIFSGRGAFIQTGAIFGSMMLFNVWVRILPGQRKMLADAEAGRVPDYSLGLKSKTRSVHNTYFIFPVLLIMLSNHYSGVTGHPLNWLLLIVLSVSGALARHAMVTKNPLERLTLVPATVGLMALVWMTRVEVPVAVDVSALPPVSTQEIHALVQDRCVSCHSNKPTDDIFKIAPAGAVFETEDQILSYKDKIYNRVVVLKNMPFTNKTGLTEEERAKFHRWYQGLSK
ncbi:MAG: urate hydroxylase PuuD [Bdellovibrionales bacterium]|nr:urate hydroxylase PuuD [Bdellovibrionales bacterium]